MTQSIFTVVADIVPEKLPGLRILLGEMKPDPGGNAILPLARFDTVHFAAFVVGEGPALKPPKLIFESNVDGTVEEWLDDLVAGGGGGLDRIFSHCVGYPGDAVGDPRTVRAWMAERVVRPAAFHIGATGRRLDRIRDEHLLHEEIERFLDEEEAAGRLAGAGPTAVRERVQQFVRSTPSLGWALAPPPPRQTRRERFEHRRRALSAVAAAVVLSPILIPVVLVAAVVLVVKEATDPVRRDPPDPALVKELENDEDEPHIVQNHLSSVIPVKPGMLRATLLPVVLFALNLVARVSATKGKLGGIPSIHFAHWSLIDNGRHLVFLSNFDGSWESYLGDFIDKAARGLTAVWSNTVEFPRTRLLVLRGAADGPRFRQWARASQCRTQVWYSAYPRLTMPIIDNNSSIREDLFARLDEKGTTEWLKRL